MHRALEGLDGNLQIIREAAIASFALTFLNLLGWSLFTLSLWKYAAQGSFMIVIVLAILVFYLTVLLIIFGVRMIRYRRLWAGKLKELEDLEARLAEQLGFRS
jgi:ABC-type multidrug transport system fused ATPase/permease subunit